MYGIHTSINEKLHRFSHTIHKDTHIDEKKKITLNCIIPRSIRLICLAYSSGINHELCVVCVNCLESN